MKIVLVSLSLFFVGCASTAQIQSSPSGAEVYNNGVLIGTTPTNITDSNIMFAKKTLQIRKEGYRENMVTVEKDSFQILPTIFGCWLVVPWLWMFGYPDTPYVAKLEKFEASEKK